MWDSGDNSHHATVGGLKALTVTPLRKGMIEIRVKVKERVGGWLNGLGRMLGMGRGAVDGESSRADAVVVNADYQ